MPRLKSSVVPIKQPVEVTALLPKDLYTIPEVAVRMSTTVFAVRSECRSGALRYIAIGHAWLISPQAIQDYIRRREKEEAS